MELPKNPAPSNQGIEWQPLFEPWAKTVGHQPGLSVRDHCLNVGCVAEALLAELASNVRVLLPRGVATLAALHDVGKISPGFLVKCPAWIARNGLTETAARERWSSPLQAESDHAKITQYFLQSALKPAGSHGGWSVAAGVHHGRIFGRRVPRGAEVSEREGWAERTRQALMDELVEIFGALPTDPPGKDDVALWLVAGLISVADWIGSNEEFFPADRGLTLVQSRTAAASALRQIRWRGGKFRPAEFPDLFGGYSPKSLQQQLHVQCDSPGLFIVEGPMGCGKTEAALWAVHRLVTAGLNDGAFFALPTQVTSNRIHRRVAGFLTAALDDADDAATLRLAHGASWLEDCQILRLHPAVPGDAEAQEHIREGRSWFASPKHALLARFGVGTVDQALQGVVAVKHFFVRRFGLAGKVVILDEVHSYDVYTGTLVTQLIRELRALRCSVIILSATLTQARRAELVAAGGGESSEALSEGYPLITVSKYGAPVREIEIESGASRSLTLRTAAFTETEILEECIIRAEGGQHVLYLRNTVVEAQATCAAIAGSVRAQRVEVGLLHSRFPFFRRQELESEWLTRLGKQRVQDGRGSILVATQVVEQSVDIDLDFIATDLAPTDMLLQRMGRLWRHERSDRQSSEPAFWINAPTLGHGASARELKESLGKSARVYAPYVLLRTAQVFAAREAITLPTQIREVLEATYAVRTGNDEPTAWQELRTDLEKQREAHAQLADSATRVFGNQSQDDLEERLTRLRGAPTRDVILLRNSELLGRDKWRITPLDGEPLTLSGYEWSLDAARLLHRHAVRTPRYLVPPQAQPPWLSLHVRGGAAWARVDADGGLVFPESEGESALAYSPLLGLHLRPERPQPHYAGDDDEDDEHYD